MLDLSKLHKYKFHYDVVKPLWDDGAHLLFTDKTKDVYEDMTPLVPTQFDTSGYPEDHPSEIPTGMNKKVLGMFKDEVGCKQITKIVGLCAKLYSCLHSVT